MKWNGKTKGFLSGYKFFFFSIEYLGLRLTYFFCFFTSLAYVLLLRKNRNAVMSFQMKSFGVSRLTSFFLAARTFYNYATTLVDKHALMIKSRKKYTFNVKNEKFIKNLLAEGRGGLLVSGHIGNGEIAGNLIHERITSDINVLFFENEIQHIKKFVDSKTGGSDFKVIEIKKDLSHLIKIKAAASNNELIALHGDRMLKDDKYVEVDMFGNRARFPIGPFLMASKFKIPVLFVFAFKTDYLHYTIHAKRPSSDELDAESLTREYADEFIKNIESHPTQWYNFYDFYVD